MRNTCLLLSAALLLTTVAFGQGTPEWELYTGYQYNHISISAAQNLADSLTLPFALPRVDVGRSLNANGGNVSLQENENDWFGGIIDFSGSYANKRVDLSQVAVALGFTPPVIAHFRPTFYTIAGGPQFTYRKGGRKIQPFTRVMFGAAHSDLGPDSTVKTALDLLAPSFKTSSTSFALIGGVGADYTWKKCVSFRLAGDYMRSYLFNEHQGNFRVSAGLDFRIGSK